jgi:hypothetical protein
MFGDIFEVTLGNVDPVFNQFPLVRVIIVPPLCYSRLLPPCEVSGPDQIAHSISELETSAVALHLASYRVRN